MAEELWICDLLHRREADLINHYRIGRHFLMYFLIPKDRFRQLLTFALILSHLLSSIILTLFSVTIPHCSSLPPLNLAKTAPRRDRLGTVVARQSIHVGFFEDVDLFILMQTREVKVL